MVNKEIVFGQQDLNKGDWNGQAKIKVIEELLLPISVKVMPRFLGHVGFYRRLIKDFTKIGNPLWKLEEK